MDDQDHVCRWPQGRQPLDIGPLWSCPGCGGVWRVKITGSIDPADGYDFGTGQHFTSAVWERVERV